MLTQITEAATQLNPAHQQAALDYILALLQEQTAAEPAPTEEAGKVDPGNGKKQGRGWIEVKTISGNQYAYRRWREGKTLKSEYIGKVKAAP